MAPALSHPPGVSFLDDIDTRPVNVDASTYYGEREYFSRARTYSSVRAFCSLLCALRAVLGGSFVTIDTAQFYLLERWFARLRRLTRYTRHK